MQKILITGAAGQLGIELINALIPVYGAENILATDINPDAASKFSDTNFLSVNAMDADYLDKIVNEYKIDQVYHLAAILSANGEQNPLATWEVNMKSLLIVLELARKYKLKVFWPSSIAVFGRGTQRQNTPQNPGTIPNTVYGISKQAGEQWCNYYAEKFNVDVRSIRYPGLISYSSPPGGGTTDYAVDIFHKAVCNQNYECFLSEETRLPMMYMPDAVRATLELMQSDFKKIKTRTSYNISGISFTPAELFREIKKHLPEFQISYRPDFRQNIANTWPESIDDSIARIEWGWKPKYDLSKMTLNMLKNINKKRNRQGSSNLLISIL
ncbi:NAD-dependent epimerase/dehydratase family protein [Antarcticibacterium sp. 1MA-6-2]|uniref:NAD-dependent epimerase/dehydratase family protein n=1 Tax=Antarcticibacterium sp. 1MA-6-2 TaxID=2908210 RepID=UPI0038FC5E3B